MTVRMGFADTSGGQVHYRHQAGDGAPVVFYHQTASSGRMWLKTFERLAGGRPLYAFDTPGFGGSFDPAPDSTLTMTDYARWMREALADLGITQAHVVSHHTGACIAVEMVARDPALAKSLTMVGPVPLTAEERHEFSQHFGAPFTPTTSGSYLLDNWDYLRKLGADADAMLFHREMADQLRAWWGRVLAYKAVWTQDFAGFLRNIQCPLLLIAGKTDVLYPFLARALEMRPDAKTFALDGANFEPDLDPDTFADGLSAFLAEADLA
jgi:pimeloyl-ACP methyl ester carboxylesterase